ncbi:MAG: hypothetical protein KatS3mg129_2112 [Leptospiraceae bacterium]|nr:MAG: hypothetical protein KatS3mg129_2112 [Leptospiraceae bacterium]
MNLNRIKKLNFNLYSNKKILYYFLLYFFCYFGLGAYFVSLSPHMIQRFGADAKYIFLSGQIGYPLGYFISGWLSDKTKRLRFFGYLFSFLLIPSQYMLFEPDLNFYGAILFSGIVRFLFAANIQILQIAALEELQYLGFSISRAAGTFGFFCMQIIMFILELFFLKSEIPLAIEGSRGGQLGAWVHIITFFIALFVLPDKRKSESPYYFKLVIKLSLQSNISIFFILSFLYYFSYQIIDFYLGAYYRELGGMKYVYLSWILAVIVEMPFFHHHLLLEDTMQYTTNLYNQQAYRRGYLSYYYDYKNLLHYLFLKHYPYYHYPRILGLQVQSHQQHYWN